MPSRAGTRHQSDVALLLIDVINHFEFPDAENVLCNVLAIAPNLARLKARAKRSGIPTIYVDDNFGQWRSDARTMAQYCVRPEPPGKDFVRTVLPDDDDYFVLKPMHSAFHQTPLDKLLRYLQTTSVIICGLATNSCILCSVHDAKMRDLAATVPSDCCAARTAREHTQTLDHIKEITGARVLPSTSVRFAKTKRG